MSDRVVSGCTLRSGERSLSAQALHSEAAKAAAGLKALSVGEGHRVAYLLRNDFPCFLLHQAAQFLGFDAVPVNWHLLPKEVQYILRDCDARVVVIHDDLLDESMAAVMAGRG